MAEGRKKSKKFFERTGRFFEFPVTGWVLVFPSPRRPVPYPTTDRHGDQQRPKGAYHCGARGQVCPEGEKDSTDASGYRDEVAGHELGFEITEQKNAADGRDDQIGEDEEQAGNAHKAGRPVRKPHKRESPRRGPAGRFELLCPARRRSP